MTTDPATAARLVAELVALMQLEPLGGDKFLAQSEDIGTPAVFGGRVKTEVTLDMLNLINRASVIINTAGTAILGLFGGGMDLAYQGGDLSAIPLPSVAYTAPGA